MNHRTTTAALLLAATLALTACSSSDSSVNKADPKPKASTPKKQAGPTAKQAAAQLAKATGVTTLGDPKDNTGSCSNKAAGMKANAKDCSQLITTDTVSIYEFPSVKVADQWTTSRKKIDKTWRQVDRYALSWSSRDQALTSKDRRTELETALRKITKP
ncbi:hypothetical protein ABZ369_39345 [Streptomyces sp. NPDC005918]|uniref:hypothetical protein n=1 Tax=Streptomyces sp. NPDC005918 TaxID=3155454 RepID=UPI00340725E1